MNRREFMKASAAAVVVGALPSLPAVAAPGFRIRYQSWPFQSTRPEIYASGTCGWKRFKELRDQLAEIYDCKIYWARIAASPTETGK